MDRARLVVPATAAVIVGVALLSGPAVGVVDLTSERPDLFGGNVGEGNATIDRVELPDRVRFERAFQSENYNVVVPDARIHVAAVSGRPLVEYRLRVPALGYTRLSTASLRETGWTTISMPPDPIGGDQITRSSYDATLSVSIRTDGNETVVAQRQVTVEVGS